MSEFLTGLACYFDTGGDMEMLLKIHMMQLVEIKYFFNAAAGDQTKGAINFKLTN